MRYCVQGENNKGTALIVNKKFKSKLFHNPESILQHRVFNLSTRHSIQAVTKGETKRVKETYTKLPSKSTNIHTAQTEKMNLG